MNAMMKQLKIATTLLLLLTILTGIIYPATVLLIAQLIFPWRANGSLIIHNGKIIGSELIGQSFTSPTYFWGRPSATTPFEYNAANSSGSNLGPSNPLLLTGITKRLTLLHAADPQNIDPVPVDLVTSSASGVDPDISLSAAYYQINRIVKFRKNISRHDLITLIDKITKRSTLGILGEPRVNVLELNLALDNYKGT